MAKKAFNLYLEEDLIIRVKKLASTIPGSSVSEMVASLLESSIEPLETLMASAKSGDSDAQAEVMSKILADQLLSVAGEGVDVLRIIKGSSSKKEVREK